MVPKGDVPFCIFQQNLSFISSTSVPTFASSFAVVLPILIDMEKSTLCLICMPRTTNDVECLKHGNAVLSLARCLWLIFH